MTLSDKVWEFWEGPTNDRHFRWIPDSDVKQFIKDLKEEIGNMKEEFKYVRMWELINKLAGDKLI